MGSECDEAAESATVWANCQKNPGHEDFIPVHEFTLDHLPRSLSHKEYEMLRTATDLTVRIRINYTTEARPNTDELSEFRGSSRLRLGTGFISGVFSKVDKPCPCDTCNGKVVRKHWRFRVRTARHVVYNTEEAKKTKVDLFYDNETPKLDSRVITVKASRVCAVSASRDFCAMECVTHDEQTGETA